MPVIVDPLNSTDAELGAGATYFGRGFDVSNFDDITVIVDTDAPGTLQMQFSTDNANWIRSKEIEVDPTIAGGGVHRLRVVCRFFRVNYINGSTPQTIFYLQTMFQSGASSMLSTSANEVISKSNDTQLVRPTSWGQFDIARGLVGDMFSVRRSGVNLDVGTGAYEDVWYNGGAYNWLTTADNLRIAAGGDPNDDAAGTGARSVTITYLNSNWDIVTETLATAGASASGQTSQTAIRLLFCKCDVGVYTGTNAGDIVIETVGGLTVGNIRAGNNITQLSMYTIPAGHTGYVQRFSVEVQANKSAEVRFRRREGADIVAAPFTGSDALHVSLDATSEFEHVFFAYPKVPEKTDIWFDAIASSAGGSTAVNVSYDLVVVKGDGATPPQ